MQVKTKACQDSLDFPLSFKIWVLKEMQTFYVTAILA